MRKLKKQRFFRTANDGAAAHSAPLVIAACAQLSFMKRHEQMSLFRFLLLVDIAAATVTVYFFFVGLADGSVSSFNMTLWLSTLGALAAILFGGPALKRSNHPRAANLLLALLAIPACLYGAFILMIVIAQPRWN